MVEQIPLHNVLDLAFVEHSRLTQLQILIFRLGNDCIVRCPKTKFAIKQRAAVSTSGLFHSKQVFECVKTKTSTSLGLSHILKAIIAIQVECARCVLVPKFG